MNMFHKIVFFISDRCLPLYIQWCGLNAPFYVVLLSSSKERHKDPGERGAGGKLVFVFRFFDTDSHT